MDNTFYKKIEELFKNKQFETVKFEIDLLDEGDKRNPFLYNILELLRPQTIIMQKLRNTLI